MFILIPVVSNEVASPCPFCGRHHWRTIQVSNSTVDIAVQCIHCGTVGPRECSGREAAIAAWNDR